MTQDNRIRLQAPEIDFVNGVGTTGQEHDNYPAPGQQARYDWARMYWIGLLAQQSSYATPTNYRNGTPWFDLNQSGGGALKIRRNDAWVPYGNGVLIEDGLTLQDFYAQFKSLSLSPEIRFTGTSEITTSLIAIPGNTITIIAGKTDLQADVYIEGVLVNPNNVSVTPTQVILSNGSMVRPGETYAVTIRNAIVAAFTIPENLNAGYLNGHPGSYYTDASHLTGAVPTASLGSGTPNSSTYLRGDQTWSNPVLITNSAVTDSRALQLTDAATMLLVTKESDTVTMTVPTNADVAFPIGTQILLMQAGTGQILVDPDSGVAVLSSGDKYRSAMINALISLIKTDTDTWTLFGERT